jgi:hypothetical protein
MQWGQQCPQRLQNNNHLFLKEFIAPVAGVATTAINFLLQHWQHK